MDREYSYKEWKDEQSIELMCKHLLDNANMDVEISSYPLAVTLTFFVIGSDIKVVFRCSKLYSFSLKKDPEDEAMYTVLETNVVQLNDSDTNERYWEIYILPESELKIKCKDLKCFIEQMTESERNM